MTRTVGRCGRGRHSMAASSRSSCAAWAPPATGAASASRSTRGCQVRRGAPRSGAVCTPFAARLRLCSKCLGSRIMLGSGLLCDWDCLVCLGCLARFFQMPVAPGRGMTRQHWPWRNLPAASLGCNNLRTRPTAALSPALAAEAVLEAFVRLHDKGLVYRGSYMVNWSPGLQTGGQAGPHGGPTPFVDGV